MAEDVAMSDVSGVASTSSASVAMDWDPIKQKLLDADADISLVAAQELRERMEIVHTTEFPRMLSSMLPAFSTVLSNLVRPNPDTTSVEHKVRNSVLEVLSRLPNNEVLRPHAAQILNIAMEVLLNDYEDNALLACRIIFDLHKNYRQMPQEQVQPYLDFVLGAYRNLPNSIQNSFRFPADLAVAQPETPAAATQEKSSTTEKDAGKKTAVQTPPASSSSTSSPSSGIPSTPRPRLAPRAGASFRVLTECPLTVMLLFQLHPKFLKTNIQPLITLMIEALSLRPPKPDSETVNSGIKRLYHSKSRELVATQVKTISFLTQFIKGFAELLGPYEDRIASSVVSLMKICPPESIGTRRELLHATRHILATDFRRGFFRHVDSLLDERILLGTHAKNSDHAVLRPLGYSTLADLVHHARSLLTMKQLSRVVYMFSRVVHDSSLKLPLTIQTTAVRLMLNLVDTIFHNRDPNPQLGRDVLARILDTLVRKLEVLKDYIPIVEETERARSVETTDLEAAILWSKSSNESETSDDATDGCAKREAEIVKKLWSEDKTADAADNVPDAQLMVRSIVVGLKTVIWCICNYRHQREKEFKGREQVAPPPGSNEEVSSALHKLTNWEYSLLDKYITSAFPCFRVFKQVSMDGKPTKNTTPESIMMASHYRDVLSYFGAAFTVIDSYNFRRSLGTRINLLVDAIDQDHHVMVVVRHLLSSNQKSSFIFASILLAYLTEHMEELDTNDTDQYVFLDRQIDASNTDDCVSRESVAKAFERTKGPQEERKKRASTVLELFERIFKSLATYPDNEIALRPYLRKIISTCLRFTVERAEGWPDNNCILLRYVFRAISAGKFEESYKVVLPLLPTILNGLFRIFVATDNTNLRHVIIELCLTVPARLSSLLPHISLLLRMIIHALNSNTGDLVNLGLRTLEFWVDNLNPDFLYPIISKQTDYLTALMTALSSHLRPAPYPYGLLTLRLLGKLGGKNRCFLRDPLDVMSCNRDKSVLSLSYEWASGDEGKSKKDAADDATMKETDTSGVDDITIALPLQRAVEVLKLIAMSSEDDEKEEAKTDDSPSCVKLKWDDFRRLREVQSDQVDVNEYCADVVVQTKRGQSEAALCVIRSALAVILDLDDAKSDLANNRCVDATISEKDVASASSEQNADILSQREALVFQKERTATLKTICKGLMYACAVEETKEEATVLFQGFASHVFLLVVSLSEHIKKVDSYGSQLSADDDEETDEDSGGSYPLGCFLLTGPFAGKANPLVLNEALVEVLGEDIESTQKVALEAINDFVQMSRGSSKASGKAEASDSLDECDVFFESLISVLFEATLSIPWNLRSGLYAGIFLVMDGLGRQWSDRFEVEAMHVAILGLKAAPKDIPAASVQAFQFFSQVCDRLYTSPNLSSATVDGFIHDPLLDGISEEKEDKDEKSVTTYASPSEGVVEMLINELSSEKQIVRFAIRYAIKLYIIDSKPKKTLDKLLSSHMATIKRLLFARSLRLLPLSEQVGVFDALVFLVQEAPSLVPLSDQHLLAFLSEFLKMSSIGDGDMTDLNMSGYVVDKNGFVSSAREKDPQRPMSQLQAHACSVFHRRECAAKSPIEGSYVIIPEELPNGIQLRVSGLRLFRAVIRQHVDEFFDADSATPVGNIRPHVISLLFRSLISRPSTAVIAAHLTLRDVLALSTSSSSDDKDKEAKPQSRLPKELLQTCIRPVLLNLREYTRLSVPLLQGLARLLSLLSSWFNTTLGEKLLEHLQKWADPERIISTRLWITGEEPLVAAAIIDLFPLLPQASHFVERLVKTTIKLELSLPAYKPKQVASPYRKPLARYLNRHPQHAVGFFFPRLKTPVYSELFQDIVAFEDSQPLRDYISGAQCSASFLNVCFERPLGIIRSDQASSSATAPSKDAPSPSVTEILALHGIVTTPDKKNTEEALRQGIEVKQKKAQAAQKEVSRIKDQLQARLASNVGGADSQKALEESGMLAQAALDKARKDLNESKQRYASEIAKPTSESLAKDSTDDKATVRPMSIEALELQHQGFELVSTLVANDKKYISEHNDVVKAFRWLWRSKGRYLRQQHEELMPLRYNDESTMLATFLIKTAIVFPKDVDILYELLRIFLQPSTSDFSFVDSFLASTVARKLTIEQKHHLIKRLVSLLAGDGKEETKALGIRHIGIPLLLSSLASQTDSAADELQEESVPSAVSAESKEGGKEESMTAVVNQDIVNKFVTEVLFKEGSPAVCGDQLRTELLRFSTLLLERADELVAPHRKDAVKFAWSLLKSDDSVCKNWASLNLSRFISVFETPPKNVLQVYVALLRSYQQEGKELVRLALAILVPVLPKRLPPEDFQKMIDLTIKIMYEEGNSAPQLAHVLHTVVANVSVFHDNRHRFIRHLVNSLSRLGLPPTSPVEHRFLAIAIVELVLLWGQQEESALADNTVPSVGTKRKGASNDYQDAPVGERGKKKRKTDTAESDIACDESSSLLLLDADMVGSIANFLVRLRILLADSKTEGNSRRLESETTRLLGSVLSKWKDIAVRPLYFEKVVAMCLSETAAKRPTTAGIDAYSKDKESTRGSAESSTKSPRSSSLKTESSSSSEAKVADDARISSSLLSACLDVFVAMEKNVPENKFLKENSGKVAAILGPCFTRLMRPHGGESGLRQQVREFLIPILSDPKQQIFDDAAIRRVQVLIESLMLEAVGSESSQQASSSSGQRGTRDSRSTSRDEKGPGASHSSFFSVDLINEASVSSPGIIESFESSLLCLAEKLCLKHIQEATSSQRQSGLYPKQGTSKHYRQKYPTPVSGILEMVCSTTSIPDITGTATKSTANAPQPGWKRQLPAFGTALRSLTTSLRLLASSNILHTFNEARATLLRIISSILDSSDSVQVVLTAMTIVGDWLLAGSRHGPLTSAERMAFLEKIASFDLSGLSDVALQPIADLVADIVMELYQTFLKGSSVECGEDEVLPIARALLACSLNANPQIRNLILARYCNKEEVKEGIAGFQDYSPLDLLGQLFNSDFGGLGCRMWTMTFVEVLLSACSSRADRLSSDQPRDAWLPKPCKKSLAKSSVLRVTDKSMAFKAAMAREIESTHVAISRLAHGDFSLCQNLLDSLLSDAWMKLPGDESRQAMIPALEGLLSQPCYSQFIRVPRLVNFSDTVARESTRGINAIRSFIGATLKFRPLPIVDSNILAIAGEKYNCWHEALTLLAQQYEILSQNSLGDKGELVEKATLAAIRRGYSLLEESKIGLSLAAKSCSLPQTEFAVSQDTYGMVKEALGSYSALVDLAETSDQSQTVNPTDFEMDLWEERWISLQREMCQLQVVKDYASSTGDPVLLLDCAWKTQDWERLRALCASSVLLPAIEDGDPNVKMGEILLAINEGKLADVETLHVQTAQLCLQKWQLLPGLASGSTVHASLLHSFHRLVELRESGQIMVETSNHSKRRTLPDLKNLLSAWRHRLPNDFESLVKWEDIFLWRTHMFSAITSNFQQWSEAAALTALHDRPWTAIRMAKTARKHELRDVSLMSLNMITDVTMDVSDAFSKLREQILCYDNPDSDTERTGGLNLINTTNLSYFQPAQKSELFRLKAMFLESLGGRSKANRAYSHAVQMCPTYSRAWGSWGGLCSALGKLAERQYELEMSKIDKTKPDEREQVATSEKKIAQYLAQAMGCYFEAISCDPSERSRVHLPKCLWMLSKDGSSPGILCQTLETRGVPLPSWVWLPWIPQLLTSLYRTEGRSIKSLLSRIGKSYPQALYYSLRAFYLERRDVDRSRTASAGQQQSSVAYAEELMSLLRRSHAALWSSLEAILEELIVKFKPSFDEELLVYVTGIIDRAESHTDRQSLKTMGEGSDEEVIVASIKKNISRISTKFFRTPTPESSGKKDDRSRKTAEFKRKYKSAFEADFQMENDEKEAKEEAETLTLSDYFDRLKKWRRMLEDQVTSTPQSLPLIEASPALAVFASEAPDLWAGSCDPRHKDVGSGERDRSGDPEGRKQTTSSSFIAATTAAALAANVVAKTAVSEGNGGDFGGGSAAIEIPGQYFPNRTSSQDTKPFPELHAKLIRFESTVKIVQRNEQLIRKVGMIGNDGKTYTFSLQWALPYWTRTEERTAQLYSIIDKILRRGIESSRSFLSVQPTAVVPIAQRLRITEEDNSRISLDEVFRRWCEKRGKDYLKPLQCFHDEFSKQLEEAKKLELADDDAKADAELNARLQAFTKVSETCVDKNMLLEFIYEQLDGPEQLFHFRRNYTGQLSTDALIQHACCVVERTPARSVLLQRNGHVLTPDYRFEYNNHGFLEPRKIPFRLTANIQTLIGPLLIDGRFIPSMGTVASALDKAHDDLEAALRLLLRDDIVAWYTSKSTAKSDSKMQELEKQLMDRIIRNTTSVQSKMADCAPKVRKEEEKTKSLKEEPVDAKVKELVKEATDPKRLCMMPSNYQAWL